MSIKDILVHVDGDESTRAGLALAVSQAKRFGARLTGLFARREVHSAAMVAHRPSDTLLAEAAKARDIFETAAQGLETRWWQIEHGAEDEMVAEVVFCSHYVDMVVMTQPVPHTGHVPATMVEQLILDSGRPILVAPAVGKGEPIGERVVIGWRSGKQASRALHDSLPLISGARELLVVYRRDLVARDTSTPPVNIIDHLIAHGLPATGERVMTEGLGVMDTLLSRAYDVNADLLVIGGHMGKILSFRGKAGAGTRHILAHMGLPVLFSC
ncbi:universal stress protein UspA [Paramagnetospirillum marisnigri]|uniref:Universal stress protein UspA n=1 Tax=Paramagnetospirillum marisnigri TaxID=1285242 RepID=A0A178MFT3_9PROT|nr:universal stress protein [Paramagnetospirillum marisnigri]OAN46774.1 universal stress protein UspA [Paramagnetospirillum marisnigri]